MKRTELKAPSSISGRNLVLEELRVNEDWEMEDNSAVGENDPSSLLELSRARAGRGF